MGIRVNYPSERSVIMDKPILYTCKDLQEIFKCGRKKAYEIMNSQGFPSFRINTSLYVEKSELEKWIGRNRNKNINI